MNSDDSFVAGFAASREVIPKFDNVAKAIHMKFQTANEAEMFFGTLLKIWTHASSALKLTTEPYAPNYQGYRDYASVAVIARAVIESAGLLKYLFFSDMDQDEKYFLIDYMKLDGLTTQLRIPIVTAEIRDARGEIQQEIDELKNGLQASPHYSAMSERQQKKVLSTKFKPFDKSSLPMKLGFGPKAEHYYAFLSDYVHNGYVSAMQSTRHEESEWLAQSFLHPVGVALSYLIETLCKYDPSVQAFMEQDSVLKSTVASLVGWGNSEVEVESTPPAV